MKAFVVFLIWGIINELIFKYFGNTAGNIYLSTSLLILFIIFLGNLYIMFTPHGRRLLKDYYRQEDI